MDETPASQISRQLLQVHSNYTDAQKLVSKAREYVNNIHKETMKTVRKFVS